MEETNEMQDIGVIVATEITPAEQMVADLDTRIRALEAAIGELRSVRAEGPGRKTVASASLMAKGAEESRGASVDDAFRSLSVEQRIAVKSGLMRAGLLV
jgi:phage shock protein A